MRRHYQILLLERTSISSKTKSLENILRNSENIISVQLYASKFRRKVMFQVQRSLHTATVS